MNSPEVKQYLLKELQKDFKKFLAFSKGERASVDPNGDLERSLEDVLLSAKALKSEAGSSDGCLADRSSTSGVPTDIHIDSEHANSSVTNPPSGEHELSEGSTVPGLNHGRWEADGEKKDGK